MLCCFGSSACSCEMTTKASTRKVRKSADNCRGATRAT